MSDLRPKPGRSRKNFERVFCILVLAFVGMVLLIMIGFGEPIIALSEILWHLATGFVGFLSSNLRKLSSDAGTWGPGVAAFLLALIVIHGFGRSRARYRQQTWKASTTLALGMLLPLLFAISFLVPGALLQMERLSHSSWFARERSEEVYARAAMQKILFALFEHEEEHHQLPDSLELLLATGTLNRADLVHREQRLDQPPEPFIYLGNGLALSSDPSLPLLISPRYSQQGVLKRQLMTTGFQFLEIRDDELDAWIEKAMAARNGVNP